MTVSTVVWTPTPVRVSPLSSSAVGGTIKHGKDGKIVETMKPITYHQLREKVRRSLGKAIPSLTPLVTVSKKYLKHLGLWGNTVRVSGMNRVVDGTVQYLGDIVEGVCVVSSRQMDLSKVVNRCVIIIADISDWTCCGLVAEGVVMVSLSEKWLPDDYVVLVIGGDMPPTLKDKGKVWDKAFTDKLSRNMRKTVQGDGTKHHGSLGKYHGFGYIPKYGMYGQSSYGKVAQKHGVSARTFNKLQVEISHDIKCMSVVLDKILPGIIDRGQVVTQALADISTETEDNRSHLHSFLRGMMTGFACCNARTKFLHIEKDCAYTMIAVPLGKDGINSTDNFRFEFNIRTGKSVVIQLQQGTVLYYTGFGIRHRQLSVIDEGDEMFWNLSTYANKRFYENVLKSFARMKQS